MRQRRAQYLHVANVYDFLERPCQPALLGYLHKMGLDALSKVVATPKSLYQQDNALYLVSSDHLQIAVKRSDQLTAPARGLTFAQSTFFRLDYLQHKLFGALKAAVSKNMECQQIKYSYYDPLTSRYIFDNRPNSLIFVRRQGDLLVGDNITFAGVSHDEYIDARFDSNSEHTLSNWFKTQLRIQNIREDDLVEISPLVSYDGKEHIPEITQYLRGLANVGYPVHIESIAKQGTY